MKNFANKKESKKIEKFKNICQRPQAWLKTYLENILKSYGYTEVHNQKGFLYAKGEIPVLLLAHMDTVHDQLPYIFNISDEKGKTKISSPYGIGGDDRCGIYMILEIVKTLKCSVLFTEDEEIGGVGAHKFADTDFVKNLDVNYMIEFDRKGCNDAVFYNCDNEEFTQFITQEFFIENYGSFSDISVVAPAAGVCAVNLSCGYYKPHTTNEYVIFEEMETVIEKTKEIIMRDVTEPFEYIEAPYTNNFYGVYGYGGYNVSRGWDNWGSWDNWDGWNNLEKESAKCKCKKYYIEYYDALKEDYDFDVVFAESEAEAYYEFCKIHSIVSYEEVLDIYTEEELNGDINPDLIESSVVALK